MAHGGSPHAARRVPNQVTAPADISGLDVLGDQLDNPDDATLALMAAGLADAESFDRLPPCPATAS